jgi:aldehyde:ferredoxin oxidoreductase
LAYDLIDPGVDPLSAESTFIIATGLYTGTNVPGSSKVPMVTKFPTTGIIEAGNAGSWLGPNLKWAGYDILVVTGKSEKPVYLFIDDDQVSLRDAQDLWGRDIYETTDTLWDRHGEGVSVVTTGQAGENQVKISIALVDKMNTLGKGGLGAMMGYKKLKAIALRGTKGFRVKDPEAFNRVALELTEKMKHDPDHDTHIRLGRMSRYENWADVLGWPHHNVRMTAPKRITDLFRPERYIREVLGDRMACPACVTGCKDHVYVREGVHQGVSPHLSSLYGRIMNWGSRCEVGGYDNAMKCQDLCNRSGLCVHSFTALMDWAVDLYEHGVITAADTEGIELKRGFEPTVALMEQTVNREGFGKILAEGWLGAFEAIGKDSEKYAIHVKGVEPLFDPRLHRLGTVEFYEITNPRGGWGSRGRSASYIQKNRPIEEFVAWCKRTGVSEEARKRIFAQKGKFNVGRLTRYAEDWCYLADTLGGPCMEGRVRNYFSMDVHQQLYRAATGRDKSKEEIKEAGESA